MPDNYSSELLIQMIRDLGGSLRDLASKVDSLPTRHEFDAFNQRFDNIENTIDKYVLQSEFNIYKDFMEQKIANINQSARESVEDLEKRIDPLTSSIDEMKKDRIPQWLITVGMAVLAVIVNIWIAYNFHPSIGNEQIFPVSTPTPIVQRH